MFLKPIVISEFDSIEETTGGIIAGIDQHVSKAAFNNLWEFCHSENKALEDIDKVFKKTIKHGKRKIQAQNYVGTVQTTDGTIVEILPKIFSQSGKEETDQHICRKIFLRMLASVRDAVPVSFQDASLLTEKDFPILEVFISNYITEVERLYQTGLGKNYVQEDGNERFLKGKLIFHENIRRNSVDKSHFYVRFSKYEEQIPQNKIVVSTLRHLQNITTSVKNSGRIAMLLDMLSDIPGSSNIIGDLEKTKCADRTMNRYKKIISWSESILLGKGFTAFGGDCINQALLFPADKLFESYIAKLFKKYFAVKEEGVSVHTQHTEYFLVDHQSGRSRFELRPDIFINKESQEYPLRAYQSIIIDTKWKNIDQDRSDRNYLIDIKDMYQLYAYGRKYEKHLNAMAIMPSVPKLILLYPYSQKFTRPLADCYYESGTKEYGLRLQIEPFDLTADRQGCMDQIDKIISRAYDDILLVGCYSSKDHHDWIKKNMLYNIRLKDDISRHGAVNWSDLDRAPAKLLLYDVNNPNNYEWYIVKDTKAEYADYEKMKSSGYPFNNSDPSIKSNKYALYKLMSQDNSMDGFMKPSELVKTLTGYDLLNGDVPPNTNFDKGTPIFIDNYLNID